MAEHLMNLAICVFMVAVNVVCFDITILHTNDVHARFQQFNKYGADCSDDDDAAGKCFGGVARRYTKIQEIRNAEDNVVLLDAGDQFMGTLWFTVYKGLAASHFMNRLKYDVMCLGNHEFDLGVDGLAKFLDNVTFPMVSANTDVSREPRLDGKFANHHVLTVGGEQIGVIGYITEETKYISAGGETVHFTDIFDAIRKEVAILQGEGVNKIIALGHAGYRTDKLLAEIEGIDVVIGGHTDTFLYTGTPPSNEDATGPYPTVVQQEGGKMALVVQDFTWAKYLGYLHVTFDVNGDVTDYNGNPILLNATISQDPTILSELSNMYTEVKDLMIQTVGFSNVLLDGTRPHCRLRECNLGNLVADAMVDFHVNFTHADSTWAPAAIALINSGGVRASIDKGVVKAGEVISVLPFGNEIDMIKLTGKNLLEQLEISVQDYNIVDQHGRFLQFSGLKVVYNLNKPAGNRVISVHVRCLECSVPNYSPLKEDQEYNIYVNTFMIGGGDGFNFQPIERYRFNTLDASTMMEYIKRHSPIYAAEEGRITFQTTEGSSISGATSMSFNLSLCLLSVLSFLFM